MKPCWAIMSNGKFGFALHYCCKWEIWDEVLNLGKCLSLEGSKIVSKWLSLTKKTPENGPFLEV